jgi:hypothetical protein
MTQYESGTPDALEAQLAGDAAEPPATSNPGMDATADGHSSVAATQTVLLPTPSEAPAASEGSPASESVVANAASRGSLRRSQWLPLPGGGAGNAADSGPSGPRRMQGKSWRVLGGMAAVIVVVAAVAAATLPGGTTGAKTAADTSTAASPPPGTGNLVAIPGASSASRKAAPHKAARAHAAAPPTGSSLAQAGSSLAQAGSSLAQAGSPREAIRVNPPQPGVPAAVSVPEPVSFWYLNDDKGTTAADAVGAHPAAGSNIAWCTYWNGQCALFNGTDSDFVTSGPVLDTGPGSSFTVSAWVVMTAFPASGKFATIVSQDGTYDSGFYLQYSPDGKWAFSRVGSPGGSTSHRALSTSAASLNLFAHLVGVFDASDNQLRLYVNGALQGTATDPTPFAATGDLAIGRGQFAGGPSDWFDGYADQVKVWNQALTTAQVDKI